MLYSCALVLYKVFSDEPHFYPRMPFMCHICLVTFNSLVMIVSEDHTI